MLEVFVCLICWHMLPFGDDESDEWLWLHL